LNLIVEQSGIHSAQMVDQSATCFDGRVQKAHLPSGAACCHIGPKPAWFTNNLRLTIEIGRTSLFKDAIKWGRGADQYLAVHINDAAGKMKGLGNAIDSDDPRPSIWLRIEDFQHLRDRHGFGWFRQGGFVATHVWS
jgi:hypothetical protein